MAKRKSRRGQKKIAQRIAQQEAKAKESYEIKEINDKIAALKELSVATDASAKDAIKLAKAEANVAQSYGDVLTALQANRSVIEKYKNLVNSVKEITEETTKAERKRIEALAEEAKEMSSVAKTAQDYVDKIEKIGPGYEKALKESTPFFEDIGTHLGLVSKKGNAAAEAIGGMVGQKGGLRGLGRAMLNVFNPLNMGVSLLTKIIEMTIQQAFAVDKANAAYARTTGMGREFNGLITDITETQKEFGVTSEDAANALSGLRLGLSQFNTLGAATQKQMGDIVSGLDKIGVSVADSTKTINNLNKAFGISEIKAATMTRSIALSGKALGMSASDITQKFNASLSTLAVYGDRSDKIFMNIAAAAQAAGVEVGTLLGIADKFDTFSSAAKTAAKMNAILGTSFSGVNMMMLDHDQRIEEVIRGMRSTGVAFKNLDKFTQQAIAAQLGIENMADANKILGMSVGAYKKMRREQKASEKSQKALEERMNATVDAMTRMEIMMKEFAIANKDLLPKVLEIAKTLTLFIKSMMDNPWKVLTIGIVAFIAKAGLAALMQAKAIAAVGAASGGAAPGVAALGAASVSLAKSIFPVAAGIAIITYSATKLFDSITSGMVAMKAMGVGFNEAGAAALVFSAGIVAIAVAVKMLAASTGTLALLGPIGLAVAGVVAASVGVASMLSGTKGPAPLDTADLIANADKISDLSAKLKDLADNKENVREAFAAVGEGLDLSKDSLTPEIQSTLANVALIATGQAAGDMSTAMTNVSMGVSEMAATLGDYFGNRREEESKIYVQIDGQALVDFVDGRIALASKK